MSSIITGLNSQMILEDYKKQKSSAVEALRTFKEAKEKLELSVCFKGEYGHLKTMHCASENEVLESLNRSAWGLVYKELHIEHIAPKTHIEHFKTLLNDPPEFTHQNIYGVFKEYATNPRGMAMQAFAEVFMGLDKFYKSHSNFGVGKKGLPKRIVIGNCNGTWAYGLPRVADVVNALMRYRGRPDLCVQGHDIDDIIKNGGTWLKCKRQIERAAKGNGLHVCDTFKEVDNLKPTHDGYEGLTFKSFLNGNIHVFFDKQAMDEINLCLAEYYGNVLPDAWEHTERPSESKAVSKDLQFYKTPEKAADFLIDRVRFKDGDTILEPSCGDGALIDAIMRQANRRDVNLKVLGVEFDGGRANIARNKGHIVHCSNFLTWEPNQKFSKVVMNPPFYGLHYLKHIKHAYKMLKDGGTLYAILPYTAKEKDTLEEFRAEYIDLPMGSFKESGTNINTVIAIIRK